MKKKPTKRKKLLLIPLKPFILIGRFFKWVFKPKDYEKELRKMAVFYSEVDEFSSTIVSIFDKLNPLTYGHGIKFLKPFSRRIAKQGMKEFKLLQKRRKRLKFPTDPATEGPAATPPDPTPPTPETPK